MAQSTVDAVNAKTPRKRKTHFFVTFSHWSMVVLLALSLLTGMRLGWGYMESWLGGPNGIWAALLNAIAPSGTLLGVNLYLTRDPGVFVSLEHLHVCLLHVFIR